jgi:hypothetical protein
MPHTGIIGLLMGNYAECWLGSLYIGSTKNSFDNTLMQLFRPADKRQHQAAVRDLPLPMHQWADYFEDDTEEVEVVYYSAPAYVVRDRLELKGYTLATAKAAFMKRIRTEAEEYSECEYDELRELHRARATLLHALDVDQWLATLLHIKQNALGNAEPRGSDEESDTSLLNFMLKNDWYGFSGIDLNVPLRLALEICSERDNFIYNLTDLVSCEYFGKDDDFVAIASESTAGEHTARSKIIILTEGRSDGWIISESMKLLYPHLSDYFTFMDFEGAHVEGGASHLAAIVKSFAGAGIVNKVVVIFDNDTAGELAIRTVRQVQLPGNLSAMQLPDLEALRSYPTIGPSGTTLMDVNGLAASIELYLGADVLSEEGKLAHVQWTGYNPTLRKYQGEVLNKDRIQKRFKEKLQLHKGQIERTKDEGWSSIRAILAAIFSAFHTFDRDLIFAERLENYARY